MTVYSNPGYLYKLTKVPSLESVFHDLKEKEKSLYVYLLPSSGTQAANPLNNRRLHCALEDADVVVFENPPHPPVPEPVAHICKLFEEKYDHKTLLRINAALSKHLQSESIDKIDQKMGDDSKKLSLGIAAKMLILMTRGLKSEKTAPTGSDPKQTIHDKAHGKRIEYLDPRPLLEKHKELMFDKGLLELMLCTILPDGDLMREIALENQKESEAWNAGTVLPPEKKMHHFASLPGLAKLADEYDEIEEQMDLAKKISAYLSAKEKVLMVLEKDPKVLKFVPLLAEVTQSQKIRVEGPLKEPTGFFWKIKKKVEGKEKPVTVGYLLGSIHLTPNHLLQLNHRIRKSFQKSTTLSVEIDITRKERVQESRLQDAKKWEERYKRLKPEEIECICEALKKLFPLPAAMNFNDAAQVSRFIFEGIENLNRKVFTDLGLSSGIDFHLVAEAKKVQKPVEDLETEDQYAKQEQIDKPEEKASLKNVLLRILTQKEFASQEPEKLIPALLEQLSLHMKDQLQPLFDAWEQGALGKMDSPKDTVEAKMVMTQRNMNMALKIVDLMKSGKPFNCVGAGHTAGDMSVISFLNNFGFITERVLV